MKKLLFISCVIFLLLTGCGAGVSNTMSCSYNSYNGNLTSKVTYDVDYQDDEIKKVKISYDYHQDEITNIEQNNIDGVGTGTDGTTDDKLPDDDGIIDGVVGSAIDSMISGMANTILDIAGIRDRHTNVQNYYGNINGFSVQTTTDNTDNDYKVTYIIDFDNISDSDLATLNLNRDINVLRNNYIAQGFTCS